PGLIFAHSTGQCGRVLLHVGQVCAHRITTEESHVFTAEADCAFHRVVEPLHEPEQSRFARPGRPDDGGHTSGRNGEVDVSQGPIVPLRTVVAKTDTFELESVRHLGFHTYGSFLPCRVLFLDRTSPAFRGKSQYFLNSTERTERLAEGRHDPRKQCDRRDDQHHVHDEGAEFADRQRTRSYTQCADPHTREQNHLHSDPREGTDHCLEPGHA